MNKKIILIIGLLFVLLFSKVLVAQEVLIDLQTNPSIINALKNVSSYTQKNDKSTTVIDTLPFLEDFSSRSIFPSNNLWIDQDVFINDGMCINPPTIGAATFDAISGSGKIYPNSGAFQFISDHLTSQFIRLDSTKISSGLKPLSPADSLYLSFYYQPQGKGNAPEAGDSLVLEFATYPPDTLILSVITIIDGHDTTIETQVPTTHWNWIWSSQGMTYAAFKNIYAKDFRMINIPIKDPKYFTKGFQFRFYNYASLANASQPGWAGNVDQWNIDYIYLNSGRSKSDIYFDDIAYITQPHSLLKKYTAMPWKHFKNNPNAVMSDTISFAYRNLSNTTKNVVRNFTIEDVMASSAPYLYAGNNLNITALNSLSFQPTLNYTYPSNSNDSALFKISSSLKTTPDILRKNDTTFYFQKFYNFYAYDDGTPEFGYGPNNSNGCKVAYRFITNQPDTLRAIQMYFNQTFNNASQKFFDLTVWKSVIPEDVIYTKSRNRPEYADELNEFHYYCIDDATVILSDTFYIGWTQISAENLNIGFDINNNSKENIWYNVTGIWQQSSFNGSLLMRPIFGAALPANLSVSDMNTPNEFISVYPNPANTILHINIAQNISQDENLKVEIFDYQGKLQIQQELSNTLDISGLSEGIYFIRVFNTSQNKLKLGKFVISR